MQRQVGAAAESPIMYNSKLVSDQRSAEDNPAILNMNGNKITSHVWKTFKAALIFTHQLKEEMFHQIPVLHLGVVKTRVKELTTATVIGL